MLDNRVFTCVIILLCNWFHRLRYISVLLQVIVSLWLHGYSRLSQVMASYSRSQQVTAGYDRLQ